MLAGRTLSKWTPLLKLSVFEFVILQNLFVWREFDCAYALLLTGIHQDVLVQNYCMF